MENEEFSLFFCWGVEGLQRISFVKNHMFKMSAQKRKKYLHFFSGVNLAEWYVANIETPVIILLPNLYFIPEKTTEKMLSERYKS